MNMNISKDLQALDLLLNHLEDRLPRSAPVYNIVKHVRDQKCEETRVFVDCVENCRVVLCHGLSIGNDSSWYLYGEDENDVTSMLNVVRLTELCRNETNQPDTFTFFCLDDKFLEVVAQYMATRGFEMTTDFAFRLYVRHLDKTVVEMMKQQTALLPRGFTMASLRPEHASLIASNTMYATPSTLPFVRKMIEDFPSVGIYPPGQGQPVAWSVLLQHGEPGYGFTQPEFRNRKFAQIRSTEMMSRLFDRGYKAVCLSTSDDNTTMQNVFKKYPGITPLHLIHCVVFTKCQTQPMSSKL